MSKNYHRVLILFFLVVTFSCVNDGLFSQNAGINATGATPNASAILDLNTGNTFTGTNGKGLIIPNVTLSSTTDATTIGTGNVTSLLVYNKTAAGAGATAVLANTYYYWDGTKWVTFSGQGSNDWALLGNAGTTVGTNFLGTTDNVDLQFNANNIRSGLIDIANFQTFFGYASGLSSTAAGQGGTFFGYGSGQSNTGGLFNTGMGYQSLVLNVTGNYNCALGVQSLFNTTGSNNTGLGTNAGYSISSGANNTALGFWAMNNGSNTTTGSNNTAIGIYSSELLTTGSFNTSSGYSSLKNNTTGSSNVAVGGDAQFYFNASNNTAVGMWTLEGNSTPANNTGVGNSALGFCAGSGYNSGAATPNNYQTTSGSYNTFLGYSADMSAGTYSNTTTVGSFAQAGANDALILGSISGVNGATNSAKVGIGLIAPTEALHIVVPSGSGINGITADVTAGNSLSNAIYAVSTGSPNYSSIYTVASPTVAGTGFTTNLSNHTLLAVMNNSVAYSFGVFGRVVSAPSPAGGVMGYYGAAAWGCLGYHNVANTASYGMYATNGAIGTAALSTTIAARTTNSGPSINDQTSPSYNVGLGAYGDLFGACVRGNIYGMTVKGEKTSLYVDGKTIVNQPIVQLTRVEGKTVVNYLPVSATADLQLHGVAVLENGMASIAISASSLSQFASSDDLTIIVTPKGQTNGVYAEMSNGKLIIKENNGGTSNVKISWIIIGKTNIDEENYVPEDIKKNDFDSRLKTFTDDENPKGAFAPEEGGEGAKNNKVNPK
jgi:trimeric autotransporter adhesin